jgi:hypothetical protein
MRLCALADLPPAKQSGELTMAETFTGPVDILNGAGKIVISLNSNNGSVRTGTSGQNGGLSVRDSADREVLSVNASSATLYVGTSGNAGDLVVRDASNREVLSFASANAALYIGTTGNEGDLIVRDASNREVFHFDSADAALYVGTTGNEGDIFVRDASNRDVFHFDSANAALYVGAAGNEGDIIVRDDNGNDTIKLNGATGDIVLSNADAAEQFDLAAACEAPPGTVMVLDDQGALTPCGSAYDRRAVGVVAGAGDYRPGIVLDHRGSASRERVTVSMMGKVACRADAAYGPIAIGDLLTTSPTVGCAMRAGDVSRAFGAVIGKALSPLAAGTGLVDLLISLQ